MHFQPQATRCLSLICQDWHCTTILSLSQRLPKTFPSTKDETGAIQDMLTVYNLLVFRFPWQYQWAAAVRGLLVPCVGYIPGWGGPQGKADSSTRLHAHGNIFSPRGAARLRAHVLVEMTTPGLHCYRYAMVLLARHASFPCSSFSSRLTHTSCFFSKWHLQKEANAARCCVTIHMLFSVEKQVHLRVEYEKNNSQICHLQSEWGVTD